MIKHRLWAKSNLIFGFYGIPISEHFYEFQSLENGEISTLCLVKMDLCRKELETVSYLFFDVGQDTEENKLKQSV